MERAEGIHWSFRRGFGGVRVVVIDSRSGRVLQGGQRLMVGDTEWQWVTESVAGDWDHVVLATSLPLLLPHGIHALEAWNEAVCGGAWGQRAARAGERLRRAVDLEHWAASGASFEKFERLLTGLVTGARGRPPASVTVLSGDIHHSYLAAVGFPAGADLRSAVYQAVCSPIHNMLPDQFRRAQQLTTSRAGELGGGLLARLAGVRRPRIRWRITRGPWFHNMLSALEFEGRRARIRFDRTVTDQTGTPHLQPVAKPSSAECRPPGVKPGPFGPKEHERGGTGLTASPGPAGRGRRLDGPSAGFHAEVPDGYGTTGFVPSGLIWPAPGCWQVTGTVAGQSLTFVTQVTTVRS